MYEWWYHVCRKLVDEPIMEIPRNFKEYLCLDDRYLGRDSNRIPLSVDKCSEVELGEV